MRPEPKISVIVPNYNSEEYLSACLDSVVSQSLKDIEILCVDDCSEDRSLEILNDYAKRDERISVLRHTSNKGQSISRNAGIDQARGEYLFLLDSDDLLFSDKCLEKLYNIAIKDGCDEVIGGILRWDEVTEERIRGYHDSYLQNELSACQFQGNEHLIACVTSCNKLLKRSFLEEKKIRFNPHLRKFEDNLFIWKVHLFAKSISLTPLATYLHRQRTAPFSTKSIMQQREHDCYYHVKVALEMGKLFEKHKKLYKYKYLFDFYFFEWLESDVLEEESNFPVVSQKINLLGAYKPVIKNISESSIKLLPPYAVKIISLINESKIEHAWDCLVEESFKYNCSSNLKTIIRSLEQELTGVYNSKSWRLTSWLRHAKALIMDKLPRHS